jgi:hypothetical protein
MLRFVSGGCDTPAMGTLSYSTDTPSGFPLTEAELAAARHDVPRRLGALPFPPGAAFSRSLWVVFIGKWGIWSHAAMPVDDRVDLPEQENIAGLCKIVGRKLAAPPCHDDEEALVVLRRPGPTAISAADAHIFRKLCEATVGQESVPWTFYVTGPAGARECFHRMAAARRTGEQ